MIRFTFLMENKTNNPMCKAEHGLSVFIETEAMKILFDTGASDAFADNAACCGVNLDEADCCVISHGHYDHTLGVPAFCKANSHAPVYIHKDAFSDFRGTEDGKIDDYNCGVTWTEEEKKAVWPRLKLTDGSLWLNDDIVISGTIPDVEGNVPTEQFYTAEKDGSMKPDSMSHEQFLAIRNGEKGVFVFSGCSHKGVIPVLAYVKTLFPGENIACFIAGMHLYCSSAEVRLAVVDKVVEANPDLIMPVHCTGKEAISMLQERFGDRCIAAATGDSYEF